MMNSLSQATRLAAVRLLVRAGPAGLAAGEIAQALAVPANTLSNHLAVLTGSGLALASRDGRSIVYQADSSAIAWFQSMVEDLACAEETKP